MKITGKSPVMQIDSDLWCGNIDAVSFFAFSQIFIDIHRKRCILVVFSIRFKFGLEKTVKKFGKTTKSKLSSLSFVYKSKINVFYEIIIFFVFYFFATKFANKQRKISHIQIHKNIRPKLLIFGNFSNESAYFDQLCFGFGMKTWINKKYQSNALIPIYRELTQLSSFLYISNFAQRLCIECVERRQIAVYRLLV